MCRVWVRPSGPARAALCQEVPRRLEEKDGAQCVQPPVDKGS